MTVPANPESVAALRDQLDDLIFAKVKEQMGWVEGFVWNFDPRPIADAILAERVNDDGPLVVTLLTMRQVGWTANGNAVWQTNPDPTDLPVFVERQPIEEGPGQ